MLYIGRRISVWLPLAVVWSCTAYNENSFFVKAYWVKSYGGVLTKTAGLICTSLISKSVTITRRVGEKWERKREHVRASQCVWWEKSMGIDTTGVRRESSAGNEQVGRCSCWRAIECKLPTVEEQDNQFSIGVTFPAKAWCHCAGKWCKSSAEKLSSIQCAAVGQSILADLHCKTSRQWSKEWGKYPEYPTSMGKRCALKPLSSQAVASAEYFDDSEVKSEGNTLNIQLRWEKGVPWSHFPHRQSQVLNTLMTSCHKPDGIGLPGGPLTPAWWLFWLTVKVSITTSGRRDATATSGGNVTAIVRPNQTRIPNCWLEHWKQVCDERGRCMEATVYEIYENKMHSKYSAFTIF